MNVLAFPRPRRRLVLDLYLALFEDEEEEEDDLSVHRDVSLCRQLQAQLTSGQWKLIWLATK